MSLAPSDHTKQPDNRTTMELGAVLPMTAEVRDDHLFVGGVDMVELAHKEGTALYVMDEADMRNRMETYLKAFRSRYENSDVIFASKAFLNKETARIVAQEGLCLDVSGGGELWCAQQAGFPMERVFVHGNNKTPQELREAISAGVGRIVVDSRIELGRISQIAGELGVTQDVYMRVTPGVEADMRNRMETYLKAFRSRYEDSDVIFASKAFLNKETARIVAQEGLCLDVSGGGELWCAQQAGFPMERVFVHGNNKTPQELREAISAGVGRIVVDSRIELGRISEIAGELGVTQDVYMRVTPGVEADTHEYIRTGCEDSKFGFTMLNDFAFKCVKDALEAPNVRLAGFHCHIGSQIFALHSFAEAVQVMVEFIARVKETYGYEVEELDMGGGLGIAYKADDKPSTIDEFAECTVNAVRENCERLGVKLPRLAVEPGRSLVATPGLTLYTVGILKTLPGIRKYVAIDGGMSDNIRTALYHADYEPTIANKAGQPRTEIVTLCGKHCESGDAVVIDMPLQTPDLGDVIAVFGTGAYCYTMASNYNGQPRPGIVFVKDGQARVVTRRETYADLYHRDI